MLKRIRKEDLQERKEPGEREEFFGSPGSIEQQLDMCEGEDEMRGDDILRGPHLERGGPDQDPVELSDIMSDNFNMDLSEADREGDEMSGDEHSGGLQGGEPELRSQVHVSSGMPGGRSEREGEADLITYRNPEDQEDRAEVRRVSGQTSNRWTRRRER